MITALKNDRPTTVAVQRSLLAVRLAPVLAVHHRLLYDSENYLWERVSGVMGERWSRNQYAALGIHGETLQTSCAAAVRLYGMAVNDVYKLLDDCQRSVVRRAREGCQQFQSANL